MRGGGGGRAAAGDGFISCVPPLLWSLVVIAGVGIPYPGVCEHGKLACNQSTRRSLKDILALAVTVACCFRCSIPIRVDPRCILHWREIGCPFISFAIHVALYCCVTKTHLCVVQRTNVCAATDISVIISSCPWYAQFINLASSMCLSYVHVRGGTLVEGVAFALEYLFTVFHGFVCCIFTIGRQVAVL